jgi:hypothetical protein
MGSMKEDEERKNRKMRKRKKRKADLRNASEAAVSTMRDTPS